MRRLYLGIDSISIRVLQGLKRVPGLIVCIRSGRVYVPGRIGGLGVRRLIVVKLFSSRGRGRLGGSFPLTRVVGGSS